MKRKLLTALAIIAVLHAFANKNGFNQNATEQNVLTPNLGQITDMEGQPVPDVLAKGSIPGMDLYITKTGFSYVFLKYEEDLNAKSHPVYLDEKKYITHYSRVDIKLDGAALSAAQMQWANAVDWKTNYYKSADGSKGQEAVQHYHALTIKNVYPNIDWIWKIGEDGKLEYDFVVHAGGDAGLIKMNYAYAGVIPQANNLKVNTPTGGLTEGPLKAESNNQNVNIQYQFNPQTKEISFTAENYDHGKDLIIDPPLALNWSAQFGGSFSSGLRGVATDTAGNVYMVGYTNSNNFPTHNAGGSSYFDGSYNGSTDAVLMKIDSNQTLKWSVFFGGAGGDFANSVTVDSSGDIFVTGGAATGFPLLQSIGAYYQNYFAGGTSDIFIARFKANLSLYWSTMYGGSGTEEGLKVLRDGLGNVYVCGYSNSTNLSLTSNSGYYQTIAGNNDAFILEFNSIGYRMWATMYGGSSDDFATCMASDTLGNLVVGGYTSSTNFPLGSNGSQYYQATIGGSTDGFILRFNKYTGRSGATYYGGNQNDYITDVSSTLYGGYIFTGRTNSTNFPTDSTNSLAYNQTHLSGGYDGFLIRTKNDLQRTWASYYGGTSNDAGTGVVTDKDGNIFLTGFTFSTNFPLDSPHVAGVFYQSANKGNSDGFIAGFTSNGAQFWSTYKGDTCYEYPNDIAVDRRFNKFYIVGENLLSCHSTPDTGSVNNSGVSSIGFVWGFTGGSVVQNCFSASAVATHVSCLNPCNGKATLSLSGAHNPIQIVWSNGSHVNGLDSNLCSGEGYAIVKDSTGCVKEAGFYISADIVSPFITATVLPSCTGGPGQANCNVSTGTSPYQYHWYNPLGQTSSTQTEVLPANGSYYVTVTDNLGCTGYSSQYIQGTETFPADNQIYWAKYPTCGNNDGILVAKPSPNGTPIVTNWYMQFGMFLAHTDSLTGVGGSQSFSSYYTSDSSGCQYGSPVSATLDVNTDLFNSIYWQIGQPTTCSPYDSYFYLDQSYYYDNMYPLEYQLQSDNGYFQDYYDSTGDGLYQNGLQPGYYYLWIYDAQGCTYFDQFNIYPPVDTPLVTFTTSPDCYDVNATQFTTTASVQYGSGNGGQFGYYSFYWDGFVYSYGYADAVDSITYNSPNWQESLVVTGSNGCSSTYNMSLQAYNNAQNIIFDLTPPACGSSSGSIIAGTSLGWGSNSYLWSTGATTDIITGITGGQTYTVTVNNNGIDYVACAVVPAATGSNLDAQIAVSAYNCNTGNQASVVITNGTAPYQYHWGNGSTAATFATAFTGNLYVTVTDNGGCSAADVMNVRIAPQFTGGYTADVIPCYGDSALIHVTGSGGFTPYTGTGNFKRPAGTYQFNVTDSFGCVVHLNTTLTQPAILVIADSAEPILCNGGTAKVTVFASGGTPAYTGTGQVNLSAGFHTLTVTDAHGCVASTAVNIGQPNALQVTDTASSILCYGGNATVHVSASGGVPPYTGTGDFLQPAGSYTLTVTDSNGCSGVVQGVLSQPAPIQITDTATTILCFGGTTTVNVSASGGTAPYTGTGDFIKPAGTYTLTVTDSNGCSNSIQATFTQPDQLQIAIEIPDTITCRTDTIHVSVSGTGGSGPYSGTGTVIYTQNGNYQLTLTDAHGCTVDTTIQVHLQNDSVTTLANDTTVCLGSQLVLALPGITGVIWHALTNDTTDAYVINNVQNDILVYATGQNPDGCRFADTFDVKVDTCLGISSIEQANFMQLYPNPTSGKVNIKYSTGYAEEVTIEVRDELGQQLVAVANQSIAGINTAVLDVNGFAAGTYFIGLITKEQNTVKRLIITR